MLIESIYQEIKRLHFQEKKSLTELCIINDCDRNEVAERMKLEGVSSINYQNSKKLNNEYFDIIDTEAKAYWLGFIYADGCIRENMFELGLKESDIGHLEKLKIDIEYTGLIRRRECSKSYRLMFRNKLFIESLVNNGVTERKSLILQFPNHINMELIRHFIRGYFDGDGSIIKVGKTSLSTNLLGTENFLMGIDKYSPVKVYQLGSNHNSEYTLTYRFCGDRAIVFLNWLYQDSNIYLDRKYKLYNEIKQNYGIN